MQNFDEFAEFITRLIDDLQTPAILWQAAIVALCLLLAWLLSTQVKQPQQPHATAWRLGVGSLNRVAVPLLTLFLVLIARPLFKHYGPARLLDLAVPLLTSLVAIRVAVYMLRHAIPPSPLLKASERAIAYTIWAAVALHITGLLPHLFEFMEEISFTAGRQKITLLLMLQGGLAVLITLLLALTFGRLVENRIMAGEHLDMNLRLILTKLVRALLLFIAILIALPVVGIDMTVLSVFGGALGVGLGFGLQKIASNYVSGFIILLDRSIRIGDLVSADNRYGTVSRINARYTVVRGLDGTEAIIPNESLITNTVVNYSYTDNQVRLTLLLSISYHSPLEQALAILEQAAREQPRVLPEPPPMAAIRNFGDNGIELELAFWITDPEQGAGTLRSDIYLRIWREFQAAGIQLPFPQREVRLLQDGPPITTSQPIDQKQK